MTSKATCGRCKRDVTGETYQAGPVGAVTCQLCDHTLSKPKRFDNIEELFNDAIKPNESGVAFRRCLEASYPVLLERVNIALYQRWLDRLVKLTTEMAGE